MAKSPTHLSALIGVAASVLVTAGLTPPATAAGGPPSLTSVPGTVPIDRSIKVVGTGCAAGSPVSFYVWNTRGGVPPLYYNSTDTGWTAGSDGSFRRSLPLRAQFAEAAGMGVTASCAAVHTLDESSDPMADGSYFTTTAASPFAKVKAPAKATFKKRVTVKYSANVAPGTVTLRLDGTVIATRNALAGPFTKKLPKRLAVGKHRLRVTFDPSYEAATVKTTTVVKVRKAR